MTSDETTGAGAGRGRFAISPDEVEDEKGRAALARYTLDEVDLSDAPLFEAAYGALDAEFGVRGELERREVVEAWLRAPAPRTYHILAARDDDGRLAAVRDCHVSVAPRSNAIVVYLAHVLVLPEHRRSGLASLMRAAPLALARRAAATASALHSPDLLLAAEMEPAVIDEEPTLVRLVAYGKAGFAAIDPSRLPYCQPDFRDLARLGDRARPLPLVPIVRWIGHDGARSLPRRLARAYVDALYGVFATHCRAMDLEPIQRHALDVLDRGAPDDVALLGLPATTTDADRVRLLLRERVLSYHLPEVAALG